MRWERWLWESFALRAATSRLRASLQSRCVAIDAGAVTHRAPELAPDRADRVPRTGDGKKPQWIRAAFPPACCRRQAPAAASRSLGTAERDRAPSLYLRVRRARTDPAHRE